MDSKIRMKHEYKGKRQLDIATSRVLDAKMTGPQQTFNESILLETLQRQSKYTVSQEALKAEPSKKTEDAKTTVVQGTTVSGAQTVKEVIPKLPSVSKAAKPPIAEIAESVKRLPILDVSRVSVHLKPEQVMLVGKKRAEKAFLVIGVPTVKRSKAYYLLDTVQGLVSGLSKAEQSEVVIVIFVADFDVDYRSKVKAEVQNRFPSEVESGLIQVIVATIGFYPKMDKLPLLYGDSVPRVQWRSKQSLDYSFLYFHCAGLGRYFLQLEDDVLTEDKYFPKIKKFISSRATSWSTLEFGSRGFIGMMYDASHLTNLAKFCRMYFFLMPVDWLFRVFNDVWLYGNEKTNVHKPSLFKHIGTFSSLDGQVRKLEDIKNGGGALALVNNPRVHKDANNPPANVETTISEFVPKYPISDAYAKGSFWGKKILVGDIIMINFITPVKLKRFVVISGNPTYPADALENGEVFISAAPNGICDAFHSIFRYIDKSTVDTGELKIDYPVKCIKLVIDSVRRDDHQRPRWLVIKEIDVWTR